jgi:hypothetical protein
MKRINIYTRIRIIKILTKYLRLTIYLLYLSIYCFVYICFTFILKMIYHFSICILNFINLIYQLFINLLSILSQSVSQQMLFL